MKSSSKTRQVILVDEQDREVGEENLYKAHEGKGLLHRAISAFLFRKRNKQVELLIQQRSDEKIVSAGQWANTACGNVAPGQSYEDCARDRLQIELGVEEVELTELMKYRYQVSFDNGFSENEMDMIFAGWYEGGTSPNPEEVAQTKWVSWDGLVSLLRDGETQQGSLKNFTVKDFSPWLVIMLNDEQVLAALQSFLENKS